jgi:TM2 domain-containing membrane protein YozV
MDNGWSSNFQVCATCAFWMGQRTTDGTRTRAMVALGAKGDCHEGGMKRIGKPNNARCDKWQLWGGIRTILNNNSNRTSSRTSDSGKTSGNKFSKEQILFTLGIVITGTFAAIKKFFIDHKETLIIIGICLLVALFTSLLIFLISKNKKNKLNKNNTILSDVNNISSDEKQNDSIMESPHSYKQKKWTTTLLLSIFFGLLGIHRFYVGKIGTGILMILVTFFTFGIGGVIWYIIDLVNICTGKFKDKQGYEIKK